MNNAYMCRVRGKEKKNNRMEKKIKSLVQINTKVNGISTGLDLEYFCQ